MTEDNRSIDSQAKADLKKLLATYGQLNNPFSKLIVKLRHFGQWAVKLLVPDFLVGHPNLFDNLKTLRCHPRFKPLRMLLISWLILTLIVGTSGVYVLHKAPDSIAAGAQWLFESADDYAFDSNKVEISSGSAKLSQVDQTDNDFAASGFGGGKQLNTEWDSAGSSLVLDTTGRESGNGDFTSRVIDAGGEVAWDNINWTPLRPYGRELPNNQAVETGYAAGNADMSKNEMLYHLDEIAGTLANSGGEGADGTAYNEVIYGAEGKFNSGLYFDGKDDYVALDKHYSKKGEIAKLTTCAWFKAAPGEGGWSLIDFDRSEYYNLEVGWNNRSTDVVNFATRGQSGGINDLRGKTNIRDSKWHLACGVYDGKDKIIYVDGREDSRTQNPHEGEKLGSGATRYGFIGDGSEATSFNGSRNQVYFKGNIDEVAVYHDALSPVTILDQYLRGALQLKFQVRSCDDDKCTDENFVGPDGLTGSYYTDTGNVSSMSDISLAGIKNNRYFQYKVYLSTDNPEYTSGIGQVSVGPIHYPADSPSIISKYPAPQYNKLDSFTSQLGKDNEGTVKYQLSNNSTDWYYHDGRQWSLASAPDQANTDKRISKEISNFPEEVGAGNFYFKALLQSDGIQSVELESLNVDYSLEEEKDEKEKDKDKDEPKDKEPKEEPEDDSDNKDDEEDSEQKEEEEPTDPDQSDDDESQNEDQQDNDSENTQEEQDTNDSSDKDTQDEKKEDQDSTTDKTKDDSQKNDGGPNTSSSTDSTKQEGTTNTITQRSYTNSSSTTTSSRVDTSSDNSDDNLNSAELEDIKKEVNNLLAEIEDLEIQEKELNGKLEQISTVSTVDVSKLLADLQVVSRKIEVEIGDLVDKNDVIVNILTLPSSNSASLEEVRNKTLDLQALLDNISYLRSNGQAPATTLWYTFGSITFNILLTNPTSEEKDVFYKTCLPEEVRAEHVLQADGDLNLEYSEENQCLTVAVIDKIASRGSKVKKVEVEDLWSITAVELTDWQKKTEDLANELQSTMYASRAGELKKDNLDRLRKIREKQKEDTHTPQEHILSYRETKGDYDQVKANVAELEKLKKDLAGFGALAAQIGRAKKFAKSGIYAVIASGLFLLIFVIYRMWKHQMELVAAAMSVNTETLSFIKNQRPPIIRKKK
ncbi:hypothetical protein KJ903_02840 [Patescibacteria group bacterium]|nr:hypothetical protein [Patescibacteria group bacterium]